MFNVIISISKVEDIFKDIITLITSNMILLTVRTPLSLKFIFGFRLPETQCDDFNGYRI
jgi:hypothetical protein